MNDDFEAAQDKISDMLDEMDIDIDLSVPVTTRHFVYFPTFDAAFAFTKLPELDPFETDTRRSGYDDNWLVLASYQIAPEDDGLLDVARLFEQLAESLDGKYDGWESEFLAGPDSKSDYDS